MTILVAFSSAAAEQWAVPADNKASSEANMLGGLLGMATYNQKPVRDTSFSFSFLLRDKKGLGTAAAYVHVQTR